MKHFSSSLAKAFRLANYLGAAMLYLKSNYYLKEPLTTAHLKKRILGHWGTVPGLNFFYLTSSLLAKEKDQDIMFIAGPGHGYPAILANLYLEGTLGEYYPAYKRGWEGMGNLIHQFSFPGGFPSHSNPETPGVILEGGELGYSLGTAFGSVLDAPQRMTVVAIGDGEAETGPLCAAWQSMKLLHPKKDGWVLPILHINKYKISGPTLLGCMSDLEIRSYLTGQGYQPYIFHADSDQSEEELLVDFYHLLDKIYEDTQKAREHWNGEKMHPATIACISKKGWTMPKFSKGKMMEDSMRSHGIPLQKVSSDPDEFETLKQWLTSYRIEELIDKDGGPCKEITSLFDNTKYLLGNALTSDQKSHTLKLPALDTFQIPLGERRGVNHAANTEELGKYLGQVIKANPCDFLLFCPDETESNNLHHLFDVTTRRMMWPTPGASESIDQDGRVIELLSEHTLEALMQGYVMTGRSGFFVTYEAFAMIIASMVDQYNKFLEQSRKIAWRSDVPSLNFVLTSESWRQDHNGFSHQNPGFITTVLNNHSDSVRVYFPIDANMTIVMAEEMLERKNGIHLLVAGKRAMPQYLTMSEAKVYAKEGIFELTWAGNKRENPQVILAASGDNFAKEMLAAATLMKEEMPDLAFRCVYISELSCFGLGREASSSSFHQEDFEKIFPKGIPVIYAYHGYSEDIRLLLFGHPHADDFVIHGYREKGTTTTPFDMLCMNKISRYHLALEAIGLACKKDSNMCHLGDRVRQTFDDFISRHNSYIREMGDDLPEVTAFPLSFPL